MGSVREGFGEANRNLGPSPAVLSQGSMLLVLGFICSKYREKIREWL